MKKLLLATALLMGSQAAMAAKDAGCGLGSIVFDGKEDKISNILAATTNGIGTQTFGMTTGTMNCGQNAFNKAEVDQFLDANIDKVAFDMSRGQGEALQGLADVIGVDANDSARFFEVSKANFDSIFQGTESTRTDVSAALAQVMSQDATLAKYVL